MKWETCKKCPKYLCDEYKDKTKDINSPTWLIWITNILVFPKCEWGVMANKFRLYLKTADALRYVPHKNFDTLKECIDYIDKKFKKELDFESALQLTKIKQGIKNANKNTK